MKPIGSKMKERTGDFVRTLQVVGYNKDNTHEVWATYGKYDNSGNRTVKCFWHAYLINGEHIYQYTKDDLKKAIDNRWCELYDIAINTTDEEKQGKTSPILSNSLNIGKVEKNPADMVEPFDKFEGLTDFERTLADICIGWIGEELGWKQFIKDNADVLLKIAIKKFNSVQDAPFEQKPAWSEEDEKKSKDIIYILEQLKQSDKEDVYPQQLIDWLKSLRPQKQSEEPFNNTSCTHLSKEEAESKVWKQ